VSFITALENTGNARVVGELKGLILAYTGWYEIFAVGFHFCDFFFSISKQSAAI